MWAASISKWRRSAQRAARLSGSAPIVSGVAAPDAHTSLKVRSQRSEALSDFSAGARLAPNPHLTGDTWSGLARPAVDAPLRQSLGAPRGRSRRRAVRNLGRRRERGLLAGDDGRALKATESANGTRSVRLAVSAAASSPC